MWNWFLTSWSDSDSFKIATCVIAAIVTALAVSDRRSAILRPIVILAAWILKLPIRLIGVAASAIPTDQPPVQQKQPALKTVDTKPPTQQELASWIGKVRPGCVVSFVEEVGEIQLVHKGTINSITDDLALIVWSPEESDHPFTGSSGPDGQPESEHNIELIVKEHKLGDRGVTWDPSGIVLVSNGWSVISWPKFERLR